MSIENFKVEDIVVSKISLMGIKKGYLVRIKMISQSHLARYPITATSIKSPEYTDIFAPKELLTLEEYFNKLLTI